MALLSALIALRAVAQMPPIGIIDFYGLRQVSERQAREALQISDEVIAAATKRSGA